MSATLRSPNEIVTASKTASPNGRCSASAATFGTSRCAPARSMPSEKSAATHHAPDRASSTVDTAVPAARSSTRSPGPRVERLAGQRAPAPVEARGEHGVGQVVAPGHAVEHRGDVVGVLVELGAAHGGNATRAAGRPRCTGAPSPGRCGTSRRAFDLARGYRSFITTTRKTANRQTLAVRATPFLFVLIWASGFVVAKYAAPYAEPLCFLLLRYAGRRRPDARPRARRRRAVAAGPLRCCTSRSPVSASRPATSAGCGSPSPRGCPPGSRRWWSTCSRCSPPRSRVSCTSG